MKQNIWVIVIVLALAGGIVWLVANQRNDNEALPQEEKQAQPGEEAQNENLIAQAIYVCDGGKTVNAVFYQGESAAVEPGQMPQPSGSVKVNLNDGRSFDLPQTISASGARYANEDESFIFWNKGDSVMILEEGEERGYTNCASLAANNQEQSIEIISPNGGEKWIKGKKVEISWEAPETIESVNIRLMVADGGEGQSFNAAIAAGVANTGNYEWTVQELYAEVWGINDLPASDKYMLVVEDAQNNSIYDATDSAFAIE